MSRFGVLATVSVGLLAGSFVPSVAAENLDPAHMFESKADAVVLITAESTSGEVFQGTGFLIDDGSVVATALHTVKNARSIAVKTRAGEVFDVAYVWNFDARKDIAILKVLAVDLPALELGNSNEVRVGDPVFAITNPQGLEHTFSDGTVSRIRVDPSLQARVIQTTVPLSKGSSGGPLFSRSGFVVGLASFQMRDGQNLNFCIPSNYIRGLLMQDRNMDLETFRAAVAGPRALVQGSATANTRTGLNGTWRNLTSGATYNVRQIDDSLYFELVVTSDSQLTANGKVEKRANGSWSGELTLSFTCSYTALFERQKSQLCKLPLKVEVSETTAEKIQGRAQGLPSGLSIGRRECKSCLRDMNLPWEEFLLVRAE